MLKNWVGQVERGGSKRVGIASVPMAELMMCGAGYILQLGWLELGVCGLRLGYEA